MRSSNHHGQMHFEPKQTYMWCSTSLARDQLLSSFLDNRFKLFFNFDRLFFFSITLISCQRPFTYTHPRIRTPQDDPRSRKKMRSRFFKFFWPAGMEIRLIRRGCTNRPFFQVGVIPAYKSKERAADEVIGSFDPMLNEHNEKLFAVDLTRLAFWIGQGAKLTPEASHMLGKFGVGSTNFVQFKTV